MLSGSRTAAVRLAGLIGLGFLLVACESAYYGTMERFGVHKREILVDRVADARDAQTEAKEQFSSALEAFSATTGFEGGDLEDLYQRLNREFERSEDRAEAVRERIEEVESVAGALFDEWSREIGEYSSDDMRRASEARLRETRRRYEALVASMWRAESRITPVLDAFRDQVLFLKHNLNARAIASLRGDLAGIEDDVAVLLRDMEQAIAESDAFIAEMQSGD
jgi:hypothetical protein